MNEVTQADLARVFTAHFDRLQGVDYVFHVLMRHLHDRQLIDPVALAQTLRAVAAEAELQQSEDQAEPLHSAAEACDAMLHPEGEGPGPDWLRGVIDGGKK